MKKLRLLSLVLIVVLLVGVAFAEAKPDENDKYKTANDIVIVLDMSNSMTTEWPQSDPMGYRLDAAQMIVGMCDMENSRVAIVPFAGPKLPKEADTDFVSISDAGVRLEKMKKLETLRNGSLGGNTDLGNALSYAMMLVQNRRDKTNAPMIIALTDGQNSIRLGQGKTIYDAQDAFLWDSATNSYAAVYTNNYGADNDNAAKNNGRTINATTQQADAVEAAVYNQVPIYTVALKGSSTDVSRREEIRIFTEALRSMSEATGGQCIETDSTNAHDLPSVFGRLFANQIGSSLLENLTPVRESDGTYRVDIPILNSSVQEANIYIPLDNIDPESIRLTNADGEDRTNTQKDVTRLKSSDRFLLYKIHSPRSVGGNWTLRFSLKAQDTPVSDIAFNLLYSYDIALKTSIGTGYSSMQSAGQGMEISKSDTLYIASSFFTKDASGADVRSDDTSLYAVHEDQPDWYTINASYEFINSNGNVVFGGSLIPSQTNRAFELVLPLTTAFTDDNGYNQILAGDYTLHIVTDGAGLYRENWIPLTITNTPPTQLNSMAIRLNANEKDNDESWAAQTFPLDLLAYVKDEDNDRLSFEFKPVSGSDIVRIHTEAQPDGSTTASYETVLDGANNKVKAGTAVYTLNVTDLPDRRTESWDFTFEVVSVADQKLSLYACNTVSADIDANSTVEKNSDIHFAMNLTRTGDGTADNSGAVADFNGKMTVCRANNRTTPLATVDMELSDDGTRLECIYHTGNAAEDLVAFFDYSYGASPVPRQEIAFRVRNSDPYVVPGAEDTIVKKIKFNPLPEFIAFIDPITSEQELTVDLSALFKDDDNELELIYSVSNISNPDNLTTADLDNAQILLVPQSAGSSSVTFRVEDGDGRPAELVVRISLENVLQKWLMILAATLIVIVVIILIALAARPRFKSGTSLTVRVNSALQADQICDTIPGTQKKLNLSSYIDHGTAARGGILPEDLAQMIIKPMRSRNGSVLLMRAKASKGVPMLSAQLEGVELGKTPLTWQPEAELVLRRFGDDAHCVRITLSASNTFSASSGGMGEWDLSGVNLGDSSPVQPSSPFGGSGSIGSSSSDDFTW